MSKPSELIPNSFQVPNFLVDKLLCHLSGPQAKVLMVLCRKTFGWNKREDVISFGQFRKEAGVSRSAAVEALNDFVTSGLVRKTKRGTLEMSSWSLNLEADPASVLARLNPSAQIVRTKDYAAQKTSPPTGLVRTEVQNYTAQRTIDSPHSGPTETHINPKPKNKSSDQAPSPIEEVFAYFREKLKRSPHYEFDSERRRMGEAGLKACEKMARLNGSHDPAKDAVELLRLAIERLAAHPWHNGVNDTGTKYLDWELLFRGRNLRCPRKLIDYWLNDEKFPDTRGAA